MQGEYLSQTLDEQNNSCDSDYEFVNNSSSHENSDCELEGYRKFQSVTASDVATPPMAVRRLSKHFELNQSEKLKLCLSPEKISLLANSSPKHSAAQDQKAIVKNRSVPSFTIVPISLSNGKEERNVRKESKGNLPEIVLTSFEVAVAAAGRKAACNGGAVGTSRKTMETKAPSSVITNGGTPIVQPIAEAPSPITYQRDDQSPSPESYLDTQLSAASSLSNRSSENSSDLTTSASDVEPLSQQHKSSIDCGESRSVPMAVKMDSHPRSQPRTHAAPIAVNGDAVPKELQCGICHEAFKDPRTLYCLHSFCFQCLVDENFKQDSSIPFWSQPNQKDFDWKSTTNSKSNYSLKSSSVESSPEMSYRNGSSASTRPESRSSFTSFRSKKSSVKDKLRKKIEAPSPSNEQSRMIICKECQQPTELPVGGIRQLPQNFILQRKIEENNLKLGSDIISKVWCSLCYVESNTTYHCVTCTLNLCTFCKEAHERQRQTASHKIKNILEVRKARNAKRAFVNDLNCSMKCSMHAGFEMKAFCSTCLQVACTDCLVLLHKGHRHESMAKAFVNYQKVIRDSMERTRPLSDYAHHSVSRLNEAAKQIDKKCDSVQAEVEAFMIAYTEAVEHHGRTLIQQINRARESKIHMIVEQQLDLEKRSAEALNAIRFSEELTNCGTEAEILSFVNILLKRFEFCQKFKPPTYTTISDTLHFFPEIRAPTSENPRNIPLFGIITAQIVEPSLCSLEMEGFTHLRVHRKAEMIVLSRDADGMPLCHGGLKLNAQLKYKDSSTKYLPVEINDRRDGSYGIAFVPDSQGTMVLTVIINDKHIKGSPFSLAARTVRPHNGIFHCCAFCSSKGSKLVTCACEGRMHGYMGCGHGHSGHPGRRHWSCCGNVLENSECSAANKLLNP